MIRTAAFQKTTQVGSWTWAWNSAWYSQRATAIKPVSEPSGGGAYQVASAMGRSWKMEREIAWVVTWSSQATPATAARLRVQICQGRRDSRNRWMACSGAG